MDNNNNNNNNNLSKGFGAGIFAAALLVGGSMIKKYIDNEEEEKRRKRERAERYAAEQERLRRERERAEREAAKIKKVDITITSEYIKEIDEKIKSFVCPITNTIMKDPVITPHGISFEKSAIEDWLNKHNTCPVTNKPLNKKDLIKNIPLKNAITEYSKTKK